MSITSPAANATVSGSVNVNANAADNVGVQNVQLRVDGQNIGAADTSSPYSVAWNTATIDNGPHDLTAVASNAAGNTTTSAAVRVTVNNTAAGGLVMGFGFEEVSGAAVTDSSGRGNVGTVSGAARVTGGRFGRALSFDGVDDWVTLADSASLDLA